MPISNPKAVAAFDRKQIRAGSAMHALRRHKRRPGSDWRCFENRSLQLARLYNASGELIPLSIINKHLRLNYARI